MRKTFILHGKKIALNCAKVNLQKGVGDVLEFEKRQAWNPNCYRD